MEPTATHKLVTCWDYITVLTCTPTRIGCLRNNSRIFIKKLNFFLFLYLVFFVVFLFLFCINNFTIIIVWSLFLLPYFSSFSFVTIHCSPSQLLFLPLLIHTLPLSLLPPPIPPSPHYLFLLHIQHLLTSLPYQLYTTQPPAIPDSSILCDTNSSTPKHSQGPQNRAAHTTPLSPSIHPFSHPTFSATFINFTN
jgi:hypothetical protein